MSEAIIEIQSLSKVFKTKGAEVHALQDISLTINKGDIFGIIGMSGAGKSTLVRCMNMLERPTSGAVLFGGLDISKIGNTQLRWVRRSIGMIFQQFNLLMQRTAEGNVLFPMEIAGVNREEAKKRAAELLKMVGLEDKLHAYPSQLSGGQKQRVAIARALATNPAVLLCDEATSALDPNTTSAILALLKDINKRLGITIVMITHQMSVIEEICNRVAIISDSRIAECGTVQEIFSHPKTAAAQRLVIREGQHTTPYFNTKNCIRIVFDGTSSFEPVVSNMVMEFQTPVNILFADSKNVDGKAFGQMILQLPEDKLLAEKIVAYLNGRGLQTEEVNLNVG